VEPKVGDLIEVVFGDYFGKRGIVRSISQPCTDSPTQVPTLHCAPKLVFGQDSRKDAVLFEVFADNCIVIQKGRDSHEQCS
jgi:hypothetical protein